MGDQSQSNSQRMTANQAAVEKAGDKQHHDGNAIGGSQSQHFVLHKSERSDHRERAQEHKQKDADRASPIVPIKMHMFRRRR